MKYDVAIIGAGITGCALAYELSRYFVKVVVLEKENDVACGATKANSGIVHAGYDPEPGTWMAKFNLQGNRMIRELCARLDVPYRQTGSLVVAFGEEDMRTLRILYERGIANGVEGLSLLTGAQARERESNLNETVTGALYAPTAGVVSPWELALALAETAVRNGVEILLNTEVSAVEKVPDGFLLRADGNSLEARFVVNAAGVFADKVCSPAIKPSFSILPSKGEYYLLDKSQAGLTRTVLFMCPNANGKGVLVAPTAHGNIIVGPDARNCAPEDTSTSREGLEYVKSQSLKILPGIRFQENIRNFAGVRAVSDRDDFIVGEDESCKDFFHAAGIKSPGLTAAPAIAAALVGQLAEKGLQLERNPFFYDTRKTVRFAELSDDERAALIEEEPAYGRVVCRCETVTEGEILDALASPVPPVSIDGVKRRCGAGMGRCQGGFCGPRVHELLARHLQKDPLSVEQDQSGSRILCSHTKE